jgi:hypothetical protein
MLENPAGLPGFPLNRSPSYSDGGGHDRQTSTLNPFYSGYFRTKVQGEGRDESSDVNANQLYRAVHKKSTVSTKQSGRGFGPEHFCTPKRL